MTYRRGKYPAFCLAAEEWLEDIRSKVKLSSYAQYKIKLEKNILPFFGEIELDKISSEKVNEFYGYLLTVGTGESYAANILSLIKMIMKYLSRVYGIPDPTVGTGLSKSAAEHKRSDAYDDESYKRLCSVLTCDTDLTKCGILLTLYTGLKIGELCALKWADIDLKAGKITVTRSIQRISTEEGSTLIFTESDKRAREIPLTGTLCDILKKWETRDEYYLLSGNDAPIEPRTMQYRLRALLKKEYLPDVSFSGLRKLFIKRCISHGAQVTVLADILGNSSVQSAVAYCEKPTLSGKIRTIDLMAEEVG